MRVPKLCFLLEKFLFNAFLWMCMKFRKKAIFKENTTKLISKLKTAKKKKILLAM
jgi:hypothetical protein